MMERENVGKMLDWEDEVFQRIQNALCNPLVDWPEISDGQSRFFVSKTIGETAILENAASRETGTIVEANGTRAEQTPKVDTARTSGKNGSFLRKNPSSLNRSENMADLWEFLSHTDISEDADDFERSPAQADVLNGESVSSESRKTELNEMPADSVLSRMYDSNEESIFQIREEPAIAKDSFGFVNTERFWENGEAAIPERADEVLFGDSIAADTAADEAGMGFFERKDTAAIASGSIYDVSSSIPLEEGIGEGVGKVFEEVAEEGVGKVFEEVAEEGVGEVFEEVFEEGDFAYTISESNSYAKKRDGNAQFLSDKTARNGLTESEMNQMLDYMVQMLEEAVSTESEGFYPL